MVTMITVLGHFGWKLLYPLIIWALQNVAYIELPIILVSTNILSGTRVESIESNSAGLALGM